MDKIKIGVSSCLLGNKVRFDGQHKLEHFITDTMSIWCDFVPVCPEVECGMPVPRESMRLVGTVENPKLMTGKTGINHTERMLSWAEKRLDKLADEDLVAFIFKTKSPSSGMRAVKVYNEKGQTVSYAGQGLFARAFMERFPDIPVEDEGRLKDPGIRENFIETIFVLQRWRQSVSDGSPGDLVKFHSRHKYTLMGHSPERLRELGSLTARAGSESPDEIRNRYLEILLKTLSIKKTVKKNANALMHIAGYFKKNLTPEEKSELMNEIELYRTGINPLLVPLTLIRHYASKYNQEYLKDQYFLYPHPIEMGLLNHV